MSGLTMTTKYNGAPVPLDSIIKELGALPRHVERALRKVRGSLPQQQYRDLSIKIAEFFVDYNGGAINSSVIKASKRVFTSFSTSDPYKFKTWVGYDPIPRGPDALVRGADGKPLLDMAGRRQYTPRQAVVRSESELISYLNKEYRNQVTFRYVDIFTKELNRLIRSGR